MTWVLSSLLLEAVLHICLLYNFVTFETRFGHIGVNIPYLVVLLSAYEQDVMIVMFQDLGSLIFTFGNCGALYISVISHFVTFEAKYGQIRVKIPCKCWYNCHSQGKIESFRE